MTAHRLPELMKFNNMLKCESLCNSVLLMINNVKTMSELTSIGKWVKFSMKRLAIKEAK